MRVIRVLVSIMVLIFFCLNFSCLKMHEDLETKPARVISEDTIKEYEEYSRKPVRVIGEDIIKKINAGEYSKIEDYIDYLVDYKPYSMDGTRLLEDLYSYVGERASYKGLSLDNWCSMYTSHHSALIMRAEYYITEAWKTRGDGWAYTVSEDGWEKFKDLLKLAEKDLKMAYSMDPRDPNSASFMITVCTGLKHDEAEMEAWFQRAIEADPIAFRAYSRKLIFLAPKWRGTMEKYAEFAEYCYRNSPAKSIIHEAMLYFITENSKKVANIKVYYETPFIKNLLDEIYSKTLKDFPKSISIRRKYSNIQTKLGKYDEAIRLLTEALEIDPGDPEVLLSRGRIYQNNLRKYELAEVDYMKSIESDSIIPLTYFQLATIFTERHRDYKRADEYYTKAIELYPKQKAYFLWRGYNKILMNRDYTSALKDCNEAEKLDERYILAKYCKAECYMKLKRFDEAKEYYRNTLELIELEKQKGDAGSISPLHARGLIIRINNALKKLSDNPS